MRPPRWGCGGWVNRALELPHVKKISVWGCGNFECWWPWQIFGNRRAEREGRLEIHAWADGRPPSDQSRRGAILRASWRERFTEFVQALEGSNLYVTIDLDCLRAEEAITNWESGQFTGQDVAWALTQLRASSAQIVGGDICGHFHRRSMRGANSVSPRQWITRNCRRPIPTKLRKPISAHSTRSGRF